MGGDGSQKLLPWRGILLLSRAQTSGSLRNHTVTETAPRVLRRIVRLSYRLPGSFLASTGGSVPARAEGADADAQSLQLAGDLFGGLMRPLLVAHRIAGRMVFQQPLDLKDHLGCFFSTGLRPPPGLRTRSHSTS